MFVRVVTTPNSPRKSIRICENYRRDGKVKQKIVHYVGIAMDEAQQEHLKAYAKDLIVEIAKKREREGSQGMLFDRNDAEGSKLGRPRKKKIKDILPPEQVSLRDIVEEERRVEGVHEVGEHLFEEIYGGLFKKKKLMERVRDIVLTRLVEPSSKHRAVATMKNHHGKEHDLSAIYRMMDEVHGSIELIKKMTLSKTQSLFPSGVDLLFFDVTTLYFESITEDELRKFGYSKDHRFNTTQVVMALATNEQGLPVGYELFEGNKAEAKTLLASLESWRPFLKIKSVCFIGDRAMFSKENLELLEKSGCHYIIAAKLRKLSQEMQEKVLAATSYHATLMDNALAWIADLKYGDDEQRRLIVGYKTKRALKDRKDRESILQKIQKKLSPSSKSSKLINNAGVKKFVSHKNEGTAFLDEEKILSDAAWDGLHGVITNLQQEAASSILTRYTRLWVIEESFRINKTTLKMRPIFHWKKERIESHVALCYMSFTLLRHLQYRVNLTQKLSIPTILEELLHVQSSILIHKKTHDRYRLPGYFSHNARKIYKTFGIERNLDASIYLPNVN